LAAGSDQVTKVSRAVCFVAEFVGGSVCLAAGREYLSRGDWVDLLSGLVLMSVGVASWARALRKKIRVWDEP
jgi:hypothetical protein